MYFFLILFFVSLAGIIFMIARKFSLVKNKEQHNLTEENFLAEILDFDRIKYLTIKNLRTGAKITVWVTLRAYILSLDFLNKKKRVVIKKIQEKLEKRKKVNPGEFIEKKEVSKYLKMISEYQQKIKKIKHKIKEQEGIE